MQNCSYLWVQCAYIISTGRGKLSDWSLAFDEKHDCPYPHVCPSRILRIKRDNASKCIDRWNNYYQYNETMIEVTGSLLKKTPACVASASHAPFKIAFYLEFLILKRDMSIFKL